MEARSPETWENTKLWEQLLGRKGVPADKLRQIVEAILPDVEVVLNKGDTMPGNFTLHDAEHSYRVAAWMAEIAGELLDELSPFDLSMLLLSAYLHDIGMTPKLGKLRAHYLYLLSGNRGQLAEEETEELQAWLDDERDGTEPPIASGAPSIDELRHVDEVLAGYVRHRHNDWSETWIREEMPSRVDQPYSGWLDDLVRLCRSHHFGIDQLKGPDFDPRLVGAPATVLHLRYCACLLRVADVIDFDPERTPPILFAHRDIEGESAIFWHKDQGVSLLKQEKHLMLDARPADAVTHHAIKKTVEEINFELALARQLDDETAFGNLNGKTLPYRWELEPRVNAVILPRDNAYEYVDGTFRPDANRLLELVGGVELYGESLAAVRELLQNAFDAVREQIALQRLGEDEPASAEVCARIAAVHKVTLTLERSSDGLKLVCRDTGIGMSREIISSRFLVGGTSAGHEARQLERECKALGFSVGRTARFGIGVLSYFLIARKMVARSRRSHEARDPDGTGWSFTSLGLTDFGELQADSSCPTGTTIELDLDPVKDDEAFAEDLRAYLADTVRRTPCPFSFTAPDFELPLLSCLGGWVANEEHVKQSGTDEDWIERRVTEALSIDERTGNLPNGLGSFRISVGTFPLSVGPSMAYMSIETGPTDDCLVAPEGNAHALAPLFEVVHSWNGMRVVAALNRPIENEWEEEFQDFDTGTRNAYIEIDWIDESVGQLMVHRNSFYPDEVANNALRFVREELEGFFGDILDTHHNSPLALLNAQLMNLAPDPSTINLSWLQGRDDTSAQWLLKKLKLPAIHEIEEGRSNSWKWRGNEVCSPSPFEIRTNSYGVRRRQWFGHLFDPQYVGALDDGVGIEPVLVWERFDLAATEAGSSRIRSAQFPPEWKELLGVNVLGEGLLGVVWNVDHPLIRVTDPGGREWIEREFRTYDTYDPTPLRDQLLSSEPLLASWFLACIEFDESYVWNSFKHIHDFLDEAWSIIPGLKGYEHLLYFDLGYATQNLHTITDSTWKTRRSEHLGGDLLETLGMPGQEWRLTPGSVHD